MSCRRNCLHFSPQSIFLFLLFCAPSALAEDFTQDLSPQDENSEVGFLQEVLRIQSPDIGGSLESSCYYGQETETAVANYQFDRLGIRDSAILGKVEDQTREGLSALISEQSALSFNAEAVTTQDTYRSSGTPSSLADLETALRERRDSMQVLARVNPRQARQMTLTKKFRSRLPKPLRSLVEQQNVKVKGTVLEVIQASPDGAASARDLYLVTKKNVVYELPDDTVVERGGRYAIRGTLLGNTLIPGTGLTDLRLIGPKPVVTIHPAAQEHLQVILIDFPDFPHANTREQVLTGLNEISNYWAKASYGKTQVVIHATDWLRSSRSFLGPNGNGLGGLVCNRGAFVTEAIILADSQVNFREKTVIMPVHSNPIGFDWDTIKCESGGAGGAFLQRTPLATGDGVVLVGNAIVSEGILSIPNRPHTQIHEFTHTFGLSHELILYCGSQLLVPNLMSCAWGNGNIDIMGLDRNGDLSAVAKDRLGWFDSTHSVTNVTTPGTYNLGVYGSPAPGVKALKIQRNATDFFYLEYRRPEGNDATSPDIVGGVVHASLLHANGSADDDNVYILPVDPRRFSGNYVIDVGETWYDKETRWAISPTSMTTNDMTVRVEKLDPVTCVPASQSATVNTVVNFTVQGGVSPYEWTGNGPPRITGHEYSTAFTQAGTYNITVHPVGHYLSSTCKVTVFAPNNPGFPVGVDLKVNGTDGDHEAPDEYGYYNSDAPRFITLQNGTPNFTLSWTTTGASTCSLNIAKQLNAETIYSGTVGISGSHVHSQPVTQPLTASINCTGGLGNTGNELIYINTTSQIQASTASGNNAECVALNYRPGVVVWDDPYLTPVQVKMKNTGTTTWSANETPHGLIVEPSTTPWTFGSDPADAYNNRRVRVPLPNEVRPGETVTFQFVARWGEEPGEPGGPGGYGYGTFNVKMTEQGVEDFGQVCRSHTYYILEGS